MMKNIIVTKDDDYQHSIVPRSICTFNKVEKVNCKLCQSSYREEAEKQFSEQLKPNYREIRRWLNGHYCC